MRGIGFYGVLSTVEEDSKAWMYLSAGWMAVGIAEEALRSGRVPSGDVAFARELIVRIDHIPANNQLTNLLNAAVDRALPGAEWRHALHTQLFAYGVDLHALGHLTAAVDVFTLLTWEVRADVDLRMQAILRRAFAQRLLSRFDDAECTYHHLAAAAKVAGDRTMALEAQLGLAKIVIGRGNFPLAATLVDAIIREATIHDCRAVLAKAFVDRAAICGGRHDQEGVIRFSHAARDLLSEGSDRDRCNMNMATAFYEVRRKEAARRRAMAVFDYGVDVDQRSAAAILLYHLALDAGDEQVRIEVREHLSTAKLSPRNAAEYYEVAARDCALHFDSAGAIAKLDQMLDVAEEHQIHEMSSRAEIALKRVNDGGMPAGMPVALTRISRATGRKLDALERDVELAPAMV